MSGLSYYSTVCKCIAVACCAYLAWFRLDGWALPLALALPLLLLTVETLAAGYCLAVCYFLAAYWPVIAASQMFLHRVDPVAGVLLWLIGAGVAALPFAWAARLTGRARRLGIVAATVAHACLPIGLASPLLAAGVVFPGLGLAGALLIATLPLWLSQRAVIATSLLALALNVGFSPPQAIQNWAAISTSTATGNPFSRQLLQNGSGSTVLVYPEGAVDEWSSYDDQWFLTDVAALKSEGRTVVFGAEVRTGHHFDNTMTIRGSVNTEYRQRVPVPIGMWGNNVDAHLMGSGVIDIHGIRAAFLMCYEQLLVLPAIQSLARNPDVIVATSNMHWNHGGSSISTAQHTSVWAWGRLAHVPVMEAINW